VVGLASSNIGIWDFGSALDRPRIQRNGLIESDEMGTSSKVKSAIKSSLSSSLSASTPAVGHVTSPSSVSEDSGNFRCPFDCNAFLQVQNLIFGCVVCGVMDHTLPGTL